MSPEDSKNKPARSSPQKNQKATGKPATKSAASPDKKTTKTPEAPAATAPTLQNLAPKPSGTFGLVQNFFTDIPIKAEQLPDHDEAIQRHQKLIQMIIWQGYAIIGLVVLILFLFPILRPTFLYSYYRSPVQKNPLEVLAVAQQHPKEMPWNEIPFSWDSPPRRLAELSAPNITKESLLSWSATAITEILTLGFGQIDKQLIRHRRWFTNVGWQSYLTAIEKQGLREEFLTRQLVLTTAPSDMPLIAGEGLNEQNQYVWYVSMPVVMNFITNNNVKSRKDATVQLEIIRVDPKENPAGIAINTWTVL